MCSCARERSGEPAFSLLLLIVLHALLPKGSNDANPLHARCRPLSFCLSLSLSLVPPPPCPLSLHRLALSALGVWVWCEDSCNSIGLLHALNKHLWVFISLPVCVCVKLCHDTPLMTFFYAIELQLHSKHPRILEGNFWFPPTMVLMLWFTSVLLANECIDIWECRNVEKREKEIVGCYSWKMKLSLWVSPNDSLKATCSALRGYRRSRRPVWSGLGGSAATALLFPLR